MKRSILWAAAVLGLAVSLAACSSETPGVPGSQASTPTGGQPTGGPFTGGNTSKPTSPTSSSGASGPLATVGPCSIVDSSDLSGFGVGPGKEDLSLAKKRECEYTKSGSFVMSVTIYDDLGIKDVTGRGELKQIKVGGHNAVQGVSAGGACIIAIEVSQNSRVDAAVSVAGAKEQEACDLASSLAQAVEKKLP